MVEVALSRVADWCALMHDDLAGRGEFLPPEEWLKLPDQSLASLLDRADELLTPEIDRKLQGAVLDLLSATWTTQELFFLDARVSFAALHLCPLVARSHVSVSLRVAIPEEAYVWVMRDVWAVFRHEWLHTLACGISARYESLMPAAEPKAWSYLPSSPSLFQ